MKLSNVIEVLNANDIYVSNYEYVSWLEFDSVMVVVCQLGEENRTYAFNGPKLEGYVEGDVFPKAWKNFKQKKVSL